MRIVCAQIDTNSFQLIFRPQRGEVGDLRLEGTREIEGGINDRLAKGENCIRLLLQMGWQSGQVRVEPDAQQRIIGAPRG